MVSLVYQFICSVLAAATHCSKCMVGRHTGAARSMHCNFCVFSKGKCVCCDGSHSRLGWKDMLLCGSNILGSWFPEQYSICLVWM
jgi:hypothetical protein